MNIAVTGGLGFIGSHIVDALTAAGHCVFIIDNLSTGKYENIEETFRLTPKELKPSIHVCDIRDDFIEEILKKISPEVVIHLAAQVSVSASNKDPFNDAEINIAGTVNVLESAKRAFIKKFIFASSSAVYGQPSSIPVNEDSSPVPISPYGVSKKSGEDYTRLYSKYFDCTALRLGNVFGPRQDPNGEAGVVSVFMDKINAGVYPEVHGDGRQVRDFVYVKDVAKAFLAAIDKGSNRVFNIASGKRTSVLELLETFARVGKLSRDPKFKDERLNDIREMVLDVEAAATALGWRASTSLEEGLREMYREPLEIPKNPTLNRPE